MRCGKKPRKTVKIFGKLSTINLQRQQETKDTAITKTVYKIWLLLLSQKQSRKR